MNLALPQAQAPPRPLRVLFVEDSADDCILLRREMERQGFAVAHERVESGDALRGALESGGWDLGQPRRKGLQEDWRALTDWRAGCGKSARPVRREGRGYIPRPRLYQPPAIVFRRSLAPRAFSS